MSIPRPSRWNIQIRDAYWTWEFLRRNPHYEYDVNKYLRVRTLEHKIISLFEVGLIAEESVGQFTAEETTVENLEAVLDGAGQAKDVTYEDMEQFIDGDGLLSIPFGWEARAQYDGLCKKYWLKLILSPNTHMSLKQMHGYPIFIDVPRMRRVIRDEVRTDPARWKNFRNLCIMGGDIGTRNLRERYTIKKEAPKRPEGLTLSMRHTPLFEQYLEAWDLKEKDGLSSKQIAAQMKISIYKARRYCRKASTLIDTFGPPSSEVPEELWQRKLRFDQHLESCKICKNATSSEDYCPIGQSFINKDYASQKDQLLEPNEIDYIFYNLIGRL